MLYPDFNELVAIKERNLKRKVSSKRSVSSKIFGGRLSPFRGHGLEFDSVREYVPGDDIRNIDWRVTARTGAPHLKLFREEKERNRVLCVDMNTTMRFGTKNTFKSVQAARVASFLGWEGLNEHECVSGCLFGDVPKGIQFFAPKKTRHSFCQLLKMMTEPQGEQHEVLLSRALSLIHKSVHTGSLIYVISDFMELGDNFYKESSLSSLTKRCDVIFIAINDPADQALFPAGMVGFCMQGKEKIYLNTDSIAGRNAYAKQWEESRKQLYELSSKFKIQLIELTTESDILRELNLRKRSC